MPSAPLAQLALRPGVACAQRGSKNLVLCFADNTHRALAEQMDERLKGDPTTADMFNFYNIGATKVAAAPDEQLWVGSPHTVAILKTRAIPSSSHCLKVLFLLTCVDLFAAC